MKRRNLLIGTALYSLSSGLVNAQEEEEKKIVKTHNFSKLVEMARQKSLSPDKKEELRLVAPFSDLSYDRYRGIRFKRNCDPLKSPNHKFSLDLLPPGRFYKDRVEICLVETDGKVIDLPFEPANFDYDPKLFIRDNLNLDSEDLKKLSYSGFRLRFPINNQEIDDEFCVFQGASYFRAVSKGTLYGLSARGFAIDTGEPRGEEFPRFSKFFIYKPQVGQSYIALDALLDSPSVCGAFHFEIFPAEQTVFAVKSVLFPRKDIKNFGIAPLTSMYYFSPTRRNAIDDYRNAVHDSDGLSMFSGSGARLWRPLNNPEDLQYSAFMDNNPRGFGLLQRQREFNYYQDNEAKYERRPSAWVEPIGKWGKGVVSLIEIPTNSEFNDNIISFWRSDTPLKAGERREFSYNLYFNKDGQSFANRRKVVATRIGKSVNNPDKYTVSIDFQFSNPVNNLSELQFVSTATKGEISGAHLENLAGNLVRAAFEYRPIKNEIAELQASISRNGEALTETWLYRWKGK